MKKFFAVLLCMAVIAGMSGCSSVNSGKRIVRISHAQSETHPEHLGLLEFKKYIEENLGEKYEVQIDTPDDMKGLKIRVQQSPASVNMVKAFGAAASPMGFGEVYTAIQQGVIDGAENNELALTNNKHGEVAKYYSYNKHQMVPDMLIGNLKFLNSLNDEEREIFEEAARLSTEVEMAAWDDQVEAAKEIAQNEMGVEFIDVDVEVFKDKVANVQQEMLDANPDIQDIYDHIQKINEEYKEAESMKTLDSSGCRYVYGYDTGLPDLYSDFPSGLYSTWHESDPFRYYDDL